MKIDSQKERLSISDDHERKPITMIVLTLKAEATSESCRELLISLSTMLTHVRGLDGCLDCRCYRSTENDREFCFIEKWETQEHLSSYLQSDLFGAMHGALEILTDSSEIELSTLEESTYNKILPLGNP